MSASVAWIHQQRMQILLALLVYIMCQVNAPSSSPNASRPVSSAQVALIFVSPYLSLFDFRPLHCVHFTFDTSPIVSTLPRNYSTTHSHSSDHRLLKDVLQSLLARLRSLLSRLRWRSRPRDDHSRYRSERCQWSGVSVISFTICYLLPNPT